jgi:hypothetical protein
MDRISGLGALSLMSKLPCNSKVTGEKKQRKINCNILEILFLSIFLKKLNLFFFILN